MTHTWGRKMVEKHTVLSTRCDRCGKVVNDDPEDWVEVSYGHNDWGNDSVESGETWHACSPPCLIALFKRIADEYQPVRGEPTLHIHLIGGFGYAWVRALGDVSLRGQPPSTGSEDS